MYEHKTEAGKKRAIEIRQMFVDRLEKGERPKDIYAALHKSTGLIIEHLRSIIPVHEAMRMLTERYVKAD